MKRMKRTMSVLLCAVMLLSLFSGLSLTASAASYYTREELESFVVDAAIAYYLKGPNVQYDSFFIKNGNRYRNAILRTTPGMSPEEASPMQRDYTVCSVFVHDVYYNVFGKHIITPDMVGALGASKRETYGVTYNSSTHKYEMMDPSVKYNANPYNSNLNDAAVQKILEYPLSMLTDTTTLSEYAQKRYNDPGVSKTGFFFDGDNGCDGVICYVPAGEAIASEDFDAFKAKLRTGDLLLAITDNSGLGGHVMLYAGDLGIIHATDRKYNSDHAQFSPTGSTYDYRLQYESGTGTEYIYGYDVMDSHNSSARNGAIRINSVDFLLGNSSKQWSPLKSSIAFAVLRPIDMLGLTLEDDTPDHFAKGNVEEVVYARRYLSGIQITTTADKTAFNDVLPGETITYTLEVKNDTNESKISSRYSGGTGYSNLTLRMPLPDNVTYESSLLTLKSKTGSTLSTSTSAYDSATNEATGVTITTGQTAILNVTVRVNDNPGDKVVLPAGSVVRPSQTSYGIPTAGMTHTVGKPRPTVFNSNTAASSILSGATSNKMDIVNAAYRYAYGNNNVEIGLTDTEEFLGTLLTPWVDDNYNTYARIKDAGEFSADSVARLWRKMIVPNYVGGQKLYTSDENGIRSGATRLLDFNEEFLQKGDVLIYAYKGESKPYSVAIDTTAEEAEMVYVYLGNSKYAYIDDEGYCQVISAPMRAFRMLNDGTELEEETPFSTYHYSYTINQNWWKCGNCGKIYPKTRNTCPDCSSSSRSADSKVRIEYSKVLTQAYRYSYFFLLRPSLAYNDISKTGTAVTVVPQNDYIQSYALLSDAMQQAKAGDTVRMNGSCTLDADAAIPAGVTLDLGTYTLTVPAGRTLDLSAGAATASTGGKLIVAGTVLYSADSNKRLTGKQVQLQGSGAYGTITIPAELAGETVYAAPNMQKEMSLNLNGLIEINHFVRDTQGLYTNQSYAKVNGTPKSMTKDGTTWYLPVCENVAKEMTTESTVQVVGKDSEGAYHVAVENTLSIRDYAERQLALVNWTSESGRKFGNAMTGMLNYGASAQLYFGANTDDLANKNVATISPTAQANMVYTPENVGTYRVDTLAKSGETSLYYSSSCVLGSSMTLRFYVDLRNRADKEDLTFRVSYRNYNNAGKTVNFTFGQLTETNVSGIYCIDASGMAAADVETPVTMTIRKNDSAILTVTDTIAGYCARAYTKYYGDARYEGLPDLIDRMMIYGLSARDYFRDDSATNMPGIGEDEMPIV